MYRDSGFVPDTDEHEYLALVLATTTAFVVACSGEAAAPSPTTTSGSSGSAGSKQSAESLLATACSQVINDCSAADLPEDFGATAELSRPLVAGDAVSEDVASAAVDALQLRIDDRTKALDALAEPASAVDGLDGWTSAWQETIDVWNSQVTALDSGDVDTMKDAFLGADGPQGAEFPEDVQARMGSGDCAQVFTLVPPEEPDTRLYREAASVCTEVLERRFAEDYGQDSELIFSEVTRPVVTREDLTEFSTEVSDAAARVAAEKRRTAEDLGELSPTVSTALDDWTMATDGLTADADRAQDRADALASGDVGRIIDAFSPVPRSEDPELSALEGLWNVGLKDRDCGRLFA